jgi:hypothetical protein
MWTRPAFAIIIAVELAICVFVLAWVRPPRRRRRSARATRLKHISGLVEVLAVADREP